FALDVDAALDFDTGPEPHGHAGNIAFADFDRGAAAQTDIRRLGILSQHDVGAGPNPAELEFSGWTAPLSVVAIHTSDHVAFPGLKIKHAAAAAASTDNIAFDSKGSGLAESHIDALYDAANGDIQLGGGRNIVGSRVVSGRITLL